MKTKTILHSFGKASILFALSLLSFANASAALKIVSESSKTCSGYPVVINASKTAEHAGNYAMLQYRINGTGSWTNSAELPTKDNQFIVDMDVNATSMVFRLLDYGTDGKPKEAKSDEITVTRQDVDCPRTCHTTTNGDYYLGTDFNLEQGGGCTQVDWNQTPPKCLESFFYEDHIVLSKGGGEAGTITTNWGYKPFLDGTRTNSYYVLKNPNAAIVDLQFPSKYFKNKYYRFTMRAYIRINGGECCYFDNQAKIMTRTGHGTVSTDEMVVQIFDDKENPKVPFFDEQAHVSGGVATTLIGEKMNKYHNNHKSSDVYRLDLIFYGKFPDKNQTFSLLPFFEQFQVEGSNGCQCSSTVAIDYISAEVESVCMDLGSICLGQSKTVNAAGFPKNADYRWYQGATELTELRGKQKVTITPAITGAIKYTVKDNNSTVAVDFVIPVKNCAPEAPHKIEGVDKICAPNSENYEAIIHDTRDKVKYHWTLKSPSGAVLATLNVDDETDNDDILKNADPLDPTCGYVTLNIPSTYADGTYTLETLLYFDDLKVGNPVSKKIKVYQTPKPTITLDDREICPFTDNLFTVTPNDPAKYAYAYEWNTTGTAVANRGKVVLPDNKCNLEVMTIAARVSVKDMPTCYGDAVISDVPVNNSKPALDCPALGKNFTMSRMADITLPEDKNSATITLPLPVVLTTCDPDPVITISASGKDVEGHNFSFTTIKKKKSLITDEDLTVTLPVTANATSSNGITFTYTATDGCNRTSESCSQKVIVRDVTAPNVDCSKIKSYDNVHLSKQADDNCVAVPGYNNELPLLSVPNLPDLNGADEVTVNYIGRLENPASEPEAVATSVGLFNHDVMFNEPYVAGTTYILWEFSDDAGNAKYCMQHVSVINDKVPDVTCPSHDYGKFSVDDNCELSYAELFAKLPAAELPTAKDPCPNGNFEYTTENARLFYRLKGEEEWIEITESMHNQNLFSAGKEYGNTYEFEWRYYKQGESVAVDKKVFGVCQSQFTVVDSVAPVTNCSLVKDAVVPFNSNSKEYRTFDYASYQLPDDTVHYNDKPDHYDAQNDKYWDDFNTYTLSDLFDVIPKAVDACDGELFPVVSVVFQNNEEVISGTEEQILKQLRNRPFKEGNTIIKYTYTDRSGNVSVCQQSIVVYSGLYAHCPEPIVLKAGADCKATYDLKPKDVPTAQVTYIREVKRKRYNADPSKGPNNRCYEVEPVAGDVEYDTLRQITDSMAPELATKKVFVYPFKIEKVTNVDEDGNPTSSSQTSIFSNSDDNTLSEAVLKVVQHMYCSTSNNYSFQFLKKTCDKQSPDYNIARPDAIQVWKKIQLRTGIREQFDGGFMTFDKGTHKLVFSYENGQGEEKSCSVIIKVEDQTPPNVVCGEWGKDYTLPADEDCQHEATLGKPTVDELNVTDNCTTNAADFTLTLDRKYWETGRSISATPSSTGGKYNDPYKMGTTILVWTVADADGNTSTCKSTIVVKDETGPTIDCKDGQFDDIHVDADPEDELCRTPATEVIRAGLKLPQFANDKCSPYIDPSGTQPIMISGTGVRDDNPSLDVFSGYYKGITTITWTFVDAAGNKTQCPQRIIVEDNTAPILDCSDLEVPITVTLASDKCTVPQAQVKLKEPSARDNCTPTDELKFSNNAPTEYKIGTNIVTWTVTDERGLSSTCDQKVVVKDTAVPKGSCPPDIDVNAPIGACEASVSIDAADYVINDPCDGELKPAFSKRSDGKALSAVYPVGTTVITWVYTDKSGNKKYCYQNVNVHDATPPVVTCPSSSSKPKEITVPAGLCAVSAADVAKKITLPTAYDECQDDDPVMSGVRYFKGKDGQQTPTLVKDAKGKAVAWNDGSVPYQPGYYTIQIVFTDNEGNESEPCDIEVFIKDINSPVVTCSDFLTDETKEFATGDNECEVTVTKADLGETNTKAYEYCDDRVEISAVPYLYANGARESTVFTQTSIKSGESATIHWVFTSATGAETVCPQVVSIVDRTEPKCTSNSLTVKTPAVSSECAADVEVVLSRIGATDNCGGDIKYEYKLDKATAFVPVTKDTTFKGLSVGTHTIKWQLTDESGNIKSNACMTSIFVEDGTYATCEDEVLPDVESADNNTDCFVNVSLPLAKNATDKCSPDDITYRYKLDDDDYKDISAETRLSLQAGTHTIYWELSDGSVTKPQACKTTVTVIDKTAPTCTNKDMGDVLSDDDVCSTNVVVKLDDIKAKDNCGNTVTYMYRVDSDTEYNAASGNLSLPLEVGKHTVYWKLSDGVNSRAEACKTVVNVLGNVPLEITCDEDAPAVTFKTDDCGPVDISSIEIPQATDPCYGKVDGTPSIDITKPLPLGDHVITWTFVNHDNTQSTTCKQTVHVVTTQKLITDCQSPAAPLKLKDGNCMINYPLTQRWATNPCNENENIRGVAYVFGNKVDPSGYASVQFPAGSWDIVWKFKSVSNTLETYEDECVETVIVDDENGATMPCKDGVKVEKIIDECVVDAADLDFKNEGVIADEICWDGHFVTPNIWVTDKDGNNSTPVHDPKDLGSFKPGKYEVTWEYIFHPSGLGAELKAYCHQPVEIYTTKEIVIDCDAAAFNEIDKDANENCVVPADEVTFNAPDAKNPCDADVSIAAQAYIDGNKIADNKFTKAFELGTTTVVWKYVDETGTLTNSVATCEQKVVVTDKTKPEVACEEDITYYLGYDANGVQSECSAAPADINLKRPSVSDNCTSSTDDFKFWLKRELNGAVVDSLAPFAPGVTVVTWTVKDQAGNASTCSMKVTVLDTVSPKPECPADLTDIKAPVNTCEAEIPAISPEAYKFKDVCDTEEIIPVGTRDDGKLISDPYPVGKTLITWVYTDSVNLLLPEDERHVFVCKQEISVADTTMPVVDCSNTASPINVETELGECQVPAEKVIDNITLPTATDQCQDEAPVMTSNRWYFGREGDSIPTRQLNAGADIKWNDDVPFKAGYYEIHFIFTDNYGNSDSCSQKVFVKDINPPYLNDCKEVLDVVLNPLDGECEVAINPVELNTYKGKEVCTGVAIEGVPALLVQNGDEFTVSADPIPATLTSGDSLYIRWTYTSQMGISAYCDQKVKAVDNQKPVIDCKVLTPDIELTADADKCFILAENANIAYPTVEDNCGTITGRPVRIDTLTNLPNGLTMADPYPTGKSVIRWYFEDTNELNTDSCDQLVFVKGSVKPEIDCDTIESVVLRDTIATCDIAEQTLVVPVPVAIDNCAPTDDLKSVKGVGTRTDGKEIDDLYPLGITTITWSFTDFTGAAVATCNQQVNIVTEQRLITNCADTTAVYALDKDECLKNIHLDQRTAKHPCPDAVADNEKEFDGVPYLNGSPTALSSLDIQLPAGTHYITWVFTDQTNTLAAPIDTCIDSIRVGNDNVPPVPCVNDKIDTTLQDLCELPAAKVDLKNTGVIADQLCGDPGEKVIPEIWLTSNPEGVVHDPADLPAITTGRDTVIWKYDFNPGHLGIFTVWCKQPIDIKTTKGIDLACPDSADNVITIIAPAHACEVPADTITLNPLVGKNPCIDTVLIAGVPDRDTTLAWPIGLTTITWTYTDTTETLVNNVAICKQYVDVKDTVNPKVDCETIYEGINQILANCKTTADDLGLKAVDVTQCGFTMTPVPTRFSGKDFNDVYVAGNDTVYWTYTYPHNGLTTVCAQPVILRDTTPVFDCSTLETITLTADEEQCVIKKSLADVLNALSPYPTATDPCDAENPIPGVYRLADADTLPTQLTAGDTIHVVWSFADTMRFADSVVCDQLVIIKGNATPVINCEEAAPAVKDTISDCGPDQELKLPIVKAYDPCFNDSIPGSFVRSDNETELNAPFQLGQTTVTWTFWNVDSTASKVCEQNVHVYTTKEIEKPCDTAYMPVVEVPAPEDACTVPADEVTLEPAFAISPCTRDTIWGVPTRFDGEELTAPYKIGKTIIVWTFNDVTDNLVIQSDTCHQIVRVGSVEVEPVKCDSFPAIEKILAEGNCTIDAAELGIKAPTIIDRCPNGAADADPEYVLPIITRFSQPGWSSSNVAEVAEFGVGYDTLWWSYPRFSTVCAQPIHIMDSVAPKFDCSSLEPILAEAPDGECELNVADIIVEPYPVAKESCTDVEIVGVPTLENGDALPETLKVGDSIVVKWTFSAPGLSTKDKICEQPVRVIGTAAPIFDCSSLSMLEFTTDECALDLNEQSIPTPVAIDSCTGKEVAGVGVRADGGDVFGTYPLGQTVITWSFTSPDSKTTKYCNQLVEVKTTKVIDAKCGEENYPALSYEVSDGNCTVPSEEVDKKLSKHAAFNPCNTDIQIDGVPSRSDNKDMSEPYEIGVTTITWTFTDTTNTLVNPVSVCEQTVTVVDVNTPPVDCPTAFPALNIALDENNCDLDFSRIPVNIDPLPAHPCTGEDMLIDTSRTSGLKVLDPYTVGVDTIVWKLWFPSNNIPVYCNQRIEVRDTIAPSFDCSMLADTIYVELKTAGNSVTFDEVKARGFFIPEVTDICTDVFTEVTRDDNKALEDDYVFGNTTITFRFYDIYGNDTICSQVVKVIDMIPPKLICPTLENHIACITDTTPAITSYEEFVAAGGSIEPESKADLLTFRHEDKVVGDDKCNAVVTRNYIVTSVTEVDVYCETPQHFYMKDSIAPTYEGIPAKGASRKTTCDQLEIDPPVVTAVDNCDPEPKLQMFSRSTQGDDPSKCDYYNYDVIYTWVATDRCGNEADSVRYTVHVVDTVAPSIDLPDDWGDPAHPIYLKKCKFGIPDLTQFIPEELVSQNCGSNEYLTYTQTPAAGTEITATTVVTLSISDVCGNHTDLEKVVEVQDRKEIVSIITGENPVVCGGDETLDSVRSSQNDLTQTKIRNAFGFTWVIDLGKWEPVPTTLFWDYYRTSFDEEHLIYSNNPETYASRFESVNAPSKGSPEEKAAADAAYARYLMLLRQHQSDVYYFVAMDTVSGCSDTASVYVKVDERPRLQLASGSWQVCEFDSLSLNGDFGNNFPVCIDNMGGTITKQGWLINDSVYHPHDSILYEGGIKHTAIYYATNHCGTTTTFNSLYTSCDGELETYKDSLAVAGSKENMELFRQDRLVLRDSVDIEVFTHFDPKQVLLTTMPQAKPRVWTGEEAELILTLPYEPSYLSWRRVEGEYDARTGAEYDKLGNIIYGGSGEDDDADLFHELWNSRDTTVADSVYLAKRGLLTFRYNIVPTDTSYYYAVVGNGVCPAVTSNLVNVDVLKELPTAITPYTKDGMNDDFMRGHHVIIFNRYGQMIHEGNDGWDGTYRGILADPGVYYYSCDMKNGANFKGSIEVVKIE